MAKSAAPLLLLGGAALLLMGGKKKKKSSGNAVAEAGPFYGPGATDDPMAPVYPGAGPLPSGSTQPPPAAPSGQSDKEKWTERQNKLQALGYAQYSGFVTGKADAATSNSIRDFQDEWNWFVAHLEQMNPAIEYKAPYTKITSDGAWGPATSSRVDKALNKFDGISAVEVEGLSEPVYNFHGMIVGLQQL
jgi:hypothetical protein